MTGAIKPEDGLSPELACLLLLVRGDLTAADQDRAHGFLEQPLAWQVIVRSASEHGVYPAVARNLRRLGWPHVPEAFRSNLEAAARLNAARNALLVRGLEQILGQFTRAAVPVIPLKGVALAESLHADVGLRVCSDLDILVPRRAVAQAFELLLAAGYEQTDRLRVEPPDVDFLVRSAMEYGFTPPVSAFPYLLELHWDIAWRWRGDTAMVDDLWAEARPQRVPGSRGMDAEPRVGAALPRRARGPASLAGIEVARGHPRGMHRGRSSTGTR